LHLQFSELQQISCQRRRHYGNMNGDKEVISEQHKYRVTGKLTAIFIVSPSGAYLAYLAPIMKILTWPRGEHVLVREV
jgi:hypothetical protein